MRGSKPWLPDKGQEGGPQRQFLEGMKHVFEVLNAGSVGSGKTDAGVMGAAIYAPYQKSPAFAGLILRHDEKDLHKHIMPLVARPGMYQRYTGGSLNTTLMVWTTRAGGHIVFSHAKRLSGLHGPEFAYVWWDELTHWKGTGWMDADPPAEYLFVNFTRVRSAAGLPCRVRAGTNAIGPGKKWVARRWGPWLQGLQYLNPAEGAPTSHRDAAESYRRLIESGHAPEPRDGQNLIPSGSVLWYHPNTDGSETWEPPPKDPDEAKRRELLSRACLRTRTEDNVAMRKDAQYSVRTRVAGSLLYRQLSNDDWDAEEPGEGFFRREMFEVVPRESVPHLAGVVARWDFAWSRHERGGKAAERSPWTVRVLLGWTQRHPQLGRDWYILHIVREQGDPNKIMPLVKRTALSDGIHVPVLAPVDFSAGKVVISDLRNLLEGYQVIDQREHGEKHVRIATLQSPAEARRIKLVAGEWNHPFLDEIARYPKKPDDQLDALAGAFLHVIESEGGILHPDQIEASHSSLSPLAAALGGSTERPRGGGRPAQRTAAEIFAEQKESTREDGDGGDWGFGGGGGDGGWGAPG